MFHLSATRRLVLLLCLVLLPACRSSAKDADEGSAVAAPRQTATLAATRVLTPPTVEVAPSLTPVPVPTRSLAPTLPPSERLAAAQEAERVGEWERAISFYESLRGDNEQSSEALLLLGDLYLRDERPVDAAAAWREALVREPNGLRAPALRYRLALGLAASGQHQAAIDLWQQVDEAMDAAADPLLAQRLADAYEALGETEAAREQLVRLYDLTGADRVARARAAHRLAQGFAAEERWGEALQWYERALDLSQIHEFRAELIGRMGNIAQKMADEGYALNQWRLLVEEYPDTPEALQAAARLSEHGDPLSLFEMGKLYLANQRWQLAARAFFDSLDEADRAEAHQQAALALEGAGQWAAARDEWQKVLDTHPEAQALFPEALLGVGQMQARLGDGAALDTWRRVADSYPDSAAAPDALWERARFRRGQGTDLRAVAFAYESMAERYPNDPRAETALSEAAWLRFRAEQPERALADWAAMAALQGKRESEALFWAGKVAYQTGDEGAARAFWRRAMQLPGAGYYSLRARSLVEERSWEPRAARDFAAPAGIASDDLAWLREAAGVAEGEALRVEPSEPLFRQGEAMLFLGERERATDAFYNAVLGQAGEPQELWAMAQRLRVLNLPNLSIFAAFRLMDALGYDALTAPPALAVLAYPIPYEEPLRAAADEWGLDPLFFASVIHQESAWEPRARSAAAARGLTQVIPDTGQWIAWRLGDADYEYRKLDRPVYSLRYGGYYLDYVLDTFEDNPFQALAAYNAGPGNAQRWLAEDDDLFVEAVTSAETRTYLEEIYRRWVAYTRLYRGS